MGNQTPTETRFRQRIATERKRRGWSQADVAQMLVGKGLPGMIATTVAKIEAGNRTVRVDEAAAFADIFGLSLDTMLGRNTDGGGQTLSYALESVTRTLRPAVAALGGLWRDFADVGAELAPLDFDERDELVTAAQQCADAITQAREALTAMWHPLHDATTQALSSELLTEQFQKFTEQDGNSNEA